MSNKNHFIIFSHGFGVQKDEHGLLTDIAQSIPEVESVLFDYYDIVGIDVAVSQMRHCED